MVVTLPHSPMRPWTASSSMNWGCGVKVRANKKMCTRGSVHSTELSTNATPVVFPPLPSALPWLPRKASLGVRVPEVCKVSQLAGTPGDLDAS